MINSLTGFPILDEGMLRAAPFGALPRVVSGFGLSFDSICGDLGLPPELLADPEAAISAADAGRLLSACAVRAALPHVGLLAGKNVGLDTLGPIGVLSREAKDVGAALRGLILALHMHDRVTVPSLSGTGDVATLSAVSLGELPVGASEIADLTMMACRNIVRELSGPGWSPREVHLARRRPPDPHPYRRIFGAPVRFDAEHNALLFDASWLSRPVRKSGDRGRDVLAEVAESHPIDLPSRVRRACVGAIIAGDTTIGRLAELAGCSRRSLNRHLAVFGTTARAELLKVKLQMARQLLSATDLPLTDIASLIGYGDAAAFTRAFRLGTGSAPSQWRSRHRRNWPASGI